MEESYNFLCAVPYNQLGLPKFPSVYHINSKASSLDNLSLFDLSSHSRARESIEFGLKMRKHGFNIFVVGEDRSGRMTATLSYLNNYVRSLEAPSDWVYLNNFISPQNPKPYRFPNGKGQKFKIAIEDFIHNIHGVLRKVFSSKDYMGQIYVLRKESELKLQQKLEELKLYAADQGYSLEDTENGVIIHPLSENHIHTEQELNTILTAIRERISEINIEAHLDNRKLESSIQDLQHTIARKAIRPFLEKIKRNYEKYVENWIGKMADDITSNLDLFIKEDEEHNLFSKIKERYAVNLFVDNSQNKHPKVLLDSNPTFESLFGTLKYRVSESGNGLETHFTYIRPGGFHLANEGILVLRADDLATNPELWHHIKSILRDKEISVEERYRDQLPPLADAPAPLPIPIDIQIVLIGQPLWYYSFFFTDPDFRTYFKIKGEIDSYLDINEENIQVYGKLLQKTALSQTGMSMESEAIECLIGNSCRWAGDRNRLSSRFEMVVDAIHEASVLAQLENKNIISKHHIQNVVNKRRFRNARLEDQHHERIEEGIILIDTTGYAIGQVNALSVISTGDHDYGVPSRVTARSYMGSKGVINIEKLTEMSGPIQQKSALIIEGFIHGLFAQDFPVSFGCSITFEQNYEGVEGDSASVAELLAILSSLSHVPIRQDIAVTGSIDQFGRVQAVGGVNHKIEGFYRVCCEKGLTGTQGVIIPKSNLRHVCLRDHLIEDLKNQKFFIWAVDTIDEAIEIATGKKAGLLLKDRSCNNAIKFEKHSVFARVKDKLQAYHDYIENMRVCT